MMKSMKKIISRGLASLLFLLPGVVPALEFDEIRDFDDVFSISAQAIDRDSIEVSWQIAEDYYLYHNKFLKFSTDSPNVVLGEAQIPEGKRAYDTLLEQDVIKFYKQLTVTLPLASVSDDVSEVNLKVRSQGCLEDVLCYPPSMQQVRVKLPARGSAEPLPVAGQAVTALPGLTRTRALTADEAFKYEAIGLSAGTLLVRFTAQPGYYLYRDKFEFRVTGDSGFRVINAELPEGTIKDDPEFGPVQVYFDLVEIPVQISRPAGDEQTITLQAAYQGCRDGDICYPPQSASVDLLVPATAEAIAGPVSTPGSLNQPATTPALSEQDALASMLLDNPAGALVAFFIAGLLLAFTPCVFPMVPILSGIIVGQGERMTTARSFWLSLVYVLAMAVTYTVAGVLAGLFGQNLQALFQNAWILGFFIAIFIALALSMFGFYELQIPAALQTRLSNASSQQKGGSLAGVAVMGFLSALIVGPCVAPPLAAALIVIGASGSAVLGGAALFTLSMGMGLPLILFGVSAGKLVPKAGPWMDAIKAVFGIGLLALAIWMLERIVQGPVILLLWGVLAVASGVYLGALEPVSQDSSGWRRLWKSLGLVLIFIGAIELLGAVSGGDNWTRPLQNLRSANPAQSVRHVEFRHIKSLDDLQQQVVLANTAGKPAMLDFYADWCVECVRMERNTFGEPQVQALFEKIQPLQADVTDNDEVDQALMAKYGVIGPPAILFFDRQGNELPAFRLVGFFDAETFTRHLQRVLDNS
jgi:thiol:disulfide interchange protein DsbD